MPISFNEKNIGINGYISDLSLTRSNRRDMTFFVNGRWVQDPSLTAAVIRAYNTMIMVGRFPVVVLFLEVPTHLVDVNVHPSKAEVRFREQEEVFSGVQRAIRRGLLAYTPVPDLTNMNLWGRQSAPEPGESNSIRSGRRLRQASRLPRNHQLLRNKQVQNKKFCLGHIYPCLGWWGRLPQPI